jgi:hypothetical protein
LIITKHANKLPVKTKLGNTVYFRTLSLLWLHALFAPLHSANPSCHTGCNIRKHGRSVLSACDPSPCHTGCNIREDGRSVLLACDPSPCHAGCNIREHGRSVLSACDTSPCPAGCNIQEHDGASCRPVYPGGGKPISVSPVTNSLAKFRFCRQILTPSILIPRGGGAAPQSESPCTALTRLAIELRYMKPDSCNSVLSLRSITKQ